MTRYALDIAGQLGDYAVLDTYSAALQAAADLAHTGDTVTVISFDGDDGELDFTPLCSVVPPITPPSTSPEAAS